MKNPKQYSKSENNMGGIDFQKIFAGQFLPQTPLQVLITQGTMFLS